MKKLRSMAVAFSMYSKIPVPSVKWDEESMKYALCFFPAVGAVIGVIQFAAGNLLLHAGCGKLFFAGVMTLIPILITGGIHMDGFMDTMDALGSYGDKEKKLAILKDSHSGAFAVLGLGCYLVWSMAVWSEIRAEVLFPVSAAYVMSRALSGFSVVNFPSARKDGLGKTFQDGAEKTAVTAGMIIWFAGAAIAALCFTGVKAAVVPAAAIFVFICYRHMALKQFGGMTGDLAGYFLQMCELVCLTAAAGAGLLS